MILIIDTTYLAHRAYHAVGQMAHEEMGTGAVFGVLRDIVLLQDYFQTRRCVFAFDYGGLTHRHRLSPLYKQTRREKHTEEPEELQVARQDFQRQIARLRRQYLPEVGFKNVFEAKGFEGDDIVAAVAAQVPRNKEAVIIGSDQDLWQCIRPNVWCFNPSTKQATTMESFMAAWGLPPARWAEVKALAGDTTDDVVGIRGVGEKTAAKYLRGELGSHTQAFQKLATQGAEHLERNMPLVKLPYPGTPRFRIQQDDVTEEKWAALATQLGMHSIRNTVPRVASCKSKGRKRGKGFGFGSA